MLLTINITCLELFKTQKEKNLEFDHDGLLQINDQIMDKNRQSTLLTSYGDYLHAYSTKNKNSETQINRQKG